MRLTTRILLSSLLVLSVSIAQTQYQTLPRGYDAVQGNASSNWPQNTVDDQIWQWHYDASEFDATGPIKITNIAIRPRAGFLVNAFNFTEWRVTLAEATTDYTANQPIFGENILRSSLVRQGSWISAALIPLPGATVGGSAWMGLDRPFVYDPTNGNDLIIQIQKCGTFLAWGTTIDVVSGGGGTLGGNRYGHTSDCVANTRNNGSGNDIIPVVRIEYEDASQTLPAGFESTEGNGAVGQPVTTTPDQKWQWHYDSGEFEFDGPVVITEIYVRPNAGNALGAFSFQNFDVTLGTAETDYTLGSHNPEFGLNLHEQKLVRSGFWSDGPFAATGGVGTWVPLDLQQQFVYDPSNGRDFIVQIENCGASTPWTSTMDGRLGVPGTVGGNRYGHTTNCLSLFSNAAGVNEFVPIIRIDFAPVTSAQGAVTRFPWREDFDAVANQTVPNGWHQVVGEAQHGVVDWTITDVPTPSFNTGPTADHTSGAGNFAYVEDSLSDNPGVSLLTPVLDLGNLVAPNLSFWLHSRDANGVTNSTLSVDVLSMPSGLFTDDVVTPIGHIGALWAEQTIDLSTWAGQSVRIRFRVNNDNGNFTHDIAIDDVRVYDQTVNFGQAPTALASLDISDALDANGLPVTPGVAGPYEVDLDFGEYADFRVGGTPGQPLILWTGSLNVANAVFPGIGQLDTGPNDILILIDGVSGAGLIPGGANIGVGGMWELSAPWTLPPGFSLPIQALVYTGGATVLALSNAVVINSI